MKKSLFYQLLLTFLLIPSSIKADSQTIGGQWRGLNNSDASILIGDDEAQDLSNVDITQSGFGIKKRAGYSQFRTIGTSTWGVRGGYYYRDVNGVDTIVNCNNRTIYTSTNSAAYVATVTTDTAGSYYDFTDSNGYIWRADDNRDEIVRITSNVVTYYPNHPKGNQIEAMPDRLVISGTSANPNRIAYSKKADFTTFTTGVLDTDPWTDDIGLPGTSVTAIKYALGMLFVWTKSTLTIGFGDNQYNFKYQDRSTTVGTDQPYSVVYDQGQVYWQAQDKHFYRSDGNTVEKISRKLNISLFGGSSVSSWLQTTQADWGAGTFGTGLSSITASGDVVYAGEIVQDIGITYYGNAPLNPYAQSFMENTGFILSYGRIFVGDYGVETATVTIRNNAAGNVPGTTIYSTATLNYTNVGATYKALTFSPPYSLIGGTTYWLYVDSRTLTNNRPGITLTNEYPRGNYWDTINGSVATADMNFRLSSSSSLYVSQSNNFGTAKTAWNTININNVLDNGTISYSFYAGGSNVSTSTYTSSQTVTNGQVPTTSNSQYGLFSALFSKTASTQAPALNDITVNYNIPSTSPVKSFGTVDVYHRILWSVGTTTNTTPDLTYIYDTRFDTWLKYDAPFQAAPLVGNYNYFGGVSTGVVYQWPSGNTDAGAAITAYWKSKDFISADPFAEKFYKSISLIAKTQTGSNLDVDYTINTSSTITRNISLTDANGNLFIRNNERLASGKLGTFFNIKFGNDDADAPFEVYVLKYEYELKPWRVLP